MKRYIRRAAGRLIPPCFRFQDPTRFTRSVAYDCAALCFRSILPFALQCFKIAHGFYDAQTVASVGRRVDMPGQVSRCSSTAASPALACTSHRPITRPLASGCSSRFHVSKTRLQEASTRATALGAVLCERQRLVQRRALKPLGLPCRTPLAPSSFCAPSGPPSSLCMAASGNEEPSKSSGNADRSASALGASTSGQAPPSPVGLPPSLLVASMSELLGPSERVLRQIIAWRPPEYVWRAIAAFVLGGESLYRICRGRFHRRNTLQQLWLVGPGSLGVCLLTLSFVGMVFTIQFIREFARLGLTRSVGGVLGLALIRELSPVITSIIVAGRVGSAFAAELGTMQVSEQTDSLRVLGTDPVDYLVAPRVLACMLATPALNVLCFGTGMAASVTLAQVVYDVPARVILDSALRAIDAWDVLTSLLKCWVFGTLIATVSCSWGFTTHGGAKGVGESTTAAVVISLVLIFVADFGLSLLFFQGQGDALRQCF